MKKNGFTLVELLAVIVIMALLISVAVPAVIGISNKMKADMFCSKINSIEQAAKNYGQDYIDDFIDGQKITVGQLVLYNYLQKESKGKDSSGKEIECQVGVENNNCIRDPRNNAGLDTVDIQLTIKNKRVSAKYDPDNKTDYSNVCNK